MFFAAKLSVLVCFILAYTLAGVEATVQLGPIKPTLQILYPTNGTVWQAGDYHNVTWKVLIQARGTAVFQGGSIQLRAANTTSFLPVLLAADFPLSAGRVLFNVPQNLATRDDFEIVLFENGNQKDVSPTFTIEGNNPPPGL